MTISAKNLPEPRLILAEDRPWPSLLEDALKDNFPFKRNLIEKYFDLLINRALINGFIGPAENIELHWIRHIIDSLLPLSASDFLQNLNEVILDLGSGAGLPGIPLAICLPQQKFILMDQSDKRCEFLEIVVEQLQLKNIDIVCAEVSEMTPQKLAKVIKQRQTSFIFRAFRKPLAALEITRHLAQLNDKVIYWRSLDFVSLATPDLKNKINQRLTALGFAQLPNTELVVPSDFQKQMSQRILMNFQVTGSCAKGYPRRWGKIKADPLCESVI